MATRDSFIHFKIDPQEDLRDAQRRFTKELLEWHMARTGGNMQEAARNLRASRETFYTHGVLSRTRPEDLQR